MSSDHDTTGAKRATEIEQPTCTCSLSHINIMRILTRHSEKAASAGGVDRS